MKFGAVLLLLLGGSSLHAEQVCDTGAHALSSPTARFEDHGDGTVTDKQTQLMWMHCSAGQRWSATACVGEIERHSWASAQALASELNRGGQYFYNDWRVPQLRELATLAERQCANPRVNLAVFPGTPATLYWTASTRPGSATDSAQAFALSFGAEGVLYRHKVEANPVRLVRSAK